MSDTSQILTNTTSRLFGDLFPTTHIPEAGAWNQAAWNAVTESGLPLALLSEEAGGFGLDTPAALGLVRVAARSSGALPLAETMLANWLLTWGGLRIVTGPATVAPASIDDDAPTLKREAGRWCLNGSVHRVPWARHSIALVLLAREGASRRIVLVPRGNCTLEPDQNIAGLPRDTLSFATTLDDSQVGEPTDLTAEELNAAGAAMRVQEISGALDSVLDMTATYAGERVQFGRPIGKQQAIQQQLAVLAGQAVAAGAAAAIAAEAFGDRTGVLAIASAKIRAGEAAGIAAGIAHQVHGAIGFAAEHRLHVYTKRLWSWRDEFGSERTWSLALGRHVLAAGADGFWPAVTALGHSANAPGA